MHGFATAVVRMSLLCTPRRNGCLRGQRFLFRCRAAGAALGAFAFAATLAVAFQFHFTEAQGDAGGDVAAVEGAAFAFAQEVGVGVRRGVADVLTPVEEGYSNYVVYTMYDIPYKRNKIVILIYNFLLLYEQLVQL